MGLNIENREASVDPLVTVRKFVTRVWEHPLVTDTTRIARANGKAKVSRLMEQHGIAQDRYFALPVGNAEWIARKESDHDTIVFTSDQDAADKIRAIPSANTGLVDIITADSILRLPHIHENWPYNVLYIPDDYIVGNIDLARHVRRYLTDSRDSETRHRFQLYAPGLFRTFFRDWKANEWYENSNSLTSNKRSERFDKALEVRSQQTHVPAVWKRVFLKNLALMESPDFSTYSAAMKISNGALALSERWRAQGIAFMENPER